MTSNGETLFATKQQERLLQAALLEGTKAVDAWEWWKTHTDLDTHLDNGSYRLLPLLYKNLHRHGVVHPLMNRLKGVYRLAWYENQLKFREAGEILRVFHEAGMQTMLLKGAALTLLHYKDNGARPMADLNVLVHPAHASAAVALLTELGWTPIPWALEAHLRYHHSMQFKNQSGRELELHWHVFYECSWEEADTDFWEGAVSTRINDVSTYALNPTDTLLYVIVHGVKWNPEPSICWIADAMTVLKTSGVAIDWPRLVEQAQKRRIGFPFKSGLQYLQDTFHVPVPASPVRVVHTMPISLIERIESWYNRKDGGSRTNTLLGDFPLHILAYLRLTNGMGAWRTIVELPKFLRYRLQAENLGHLTFLLMAKSVQRAKQTISGWL